MFNNKGGSEKVQYGGPQIGWGKAPALLLVDFQRCFTDIGAPLGGGDHIRKALGNTSVLLKFARSKAVPIIYTMVAWRKDKKDMGFWPIKIPKLTECVIGSHWAQISEEITPEENDFVLAKKMPSAFFGTELLNILISEGIDTNIIAGVTTSGCVRATIIDSFSYGFRTIVVQDCCGDKTEEAHHVNLNDVNSRYADVISLESCLRHLEKI